MTNTNKRIASAAVVAAFAIAAVGIGMSFAQSSDEPRPERASLAEAIADAFALNQDEVQIVIEEHRETMKEFHSEQKGDRLNQLVEDGTLTQEQADVLEQKREEMKTFMESLKDLDKEEIGDEMKAHMEELKQWAEDNDISMELLHGFPRHGKKGFGQKWGQHQSGKHLREGFSPQSN